MLSEEPAIPGAPAPPAPAAPQVTSVLPQGQDDGGPAVVLIRVSEDKLKAYVSLKPPARNPPGPIDADFLLRRWREAELDPEAFPASAAEALAAEWNASRSGIPERLAGEAPHPPVPGADARIEFIVDPTLRFKPADEGGSVDFRNLNLIKPVKKGQPLARKAPASLGIHGINLYGQPAPAPDGADVELPLGLNTEVSASDPALVIASVSGFLQTKDGKLHVNECFVVDGSVDFSTGNIEYDQAAVIRGDVADGFSVTVGGALEVGGSVGEAKLIAGGDVLVKKGFAGAGHGLIASKGNVSLGFASNQIIRAHGSILVEKESFNCQMGARRSLTVYGPLVGGLAMAWSGIECRVAGNELGTKTELEAGLDYVLHENKALLEEKLKELTGHLAKVTQKLTRFRESYRTRKRFSSAEAKLMLELRDMQEKIQARLPELEKRKQSIVEQIRQGYARDGICVKVEKKVNPGVVIKVGNEVFRVQEEMAGPKVFLFKEGRIKVI
jgi:uncharacterized protein (DUF342 family)